MPFTVWQDPTALDISTIRKELIMSSNGIYQKKFKPTCLMIKQHQITGKLYLCITTRKNIEKYKGSGTYWKKHINMHGKDYVQNVWYCWFYDAESIKQCAMLLSGMYKVVESEHWCNLIVENGGELDDRMENFIFRKKLSNANKGFIICKDKDGICLRVSINDPRYLSGQLVHHTKGRICSKEEIERRSILLKGKATVRNEEGIAIRVPKEEAHNYIPLNQGTKRSKETKRKQSESAKIACQTRYQPLVTRLIDKKVMTSAVFMRWLNNKPSKVDGVSKIRCCRISDKKEMSVNHFTRQDKFL